MNAKKLLKLRDHWHYTAIGESHRDSSTIAQDTATALNETLEYKRQVNELKNVLADIICEVESSLAGNFLVNDCHLAKNLNQFKAVLVRRK